jgi:O-antigen ligase
MRQGFSRAGRGVIGQGGAAGAAVGAAPEPRAPPILRVALRVLQAGAVTVVLAAGAYDVFELDRFFVPKELALHVTACAGGLLAARAFGRVRPAGTDLLLAAFLGLSAISALFATNGWLALRALAISVSGVALFWTARTLREHDLARPLLGAVALAVVLGAGTALLQTYGVRTELFSPNRVPGGTLGNRNFVAHMAAFGLPVVLLGALGARRRTGFLLGTAGAALVAASLVLTRSRAGWLAVAAALFVLLVGMIAARPLRRSGRTWARFTLVLVLGVAGVAGAVLVPNTLRWRSDSPYLESIRALAEHREGSGRGRLVQYQQSLRMALRHPLLGAGPGNWAVAYPGHAAPDDPSLDRSEPGTTANPWPSSDWVAFISERGAAATLLLLAALALLARRAVRRLFGARDAEDALAAAVLVALLAAVLVAGMFDAVLLIALPSLLVWMSLGALWPTEPADVVAAAASHADVRRRRFRPGLALALLALGAGVAAVRSGAQLAAIHVFETRSDRASLERAARLDPGNYRLHVRLARSARGREQRCAHAVAATGLYPHAQAARQLSRGCS